MMETVKCRGLHTRASIWMFVCTSLLAAELGGGRIAWATALDEIDVQNCTGAKASCISCASAISVIGITPVWNVSPIGIAAIAICSKVIDTHRKYNTGATPENPSGTTNYCVATTDCSKISFPRAYCKPPNSETSLTDIDVVRKCCDSNTSYANPLAQYPADCPTDGNIPDLPADKVLETVNQNLTLAKTEIERAMALNSNNNEVSIEPPLLLVQTTLPSKEAFQQPLQEKRTTLQRPLQGP